MCVCVSVCACVRVCFPPLTSRQATDTCAHLGKRSKQCHVKFELSVRSAQPQSAFTLFSKTTRPRGLFTRCLLSKKACLYAGADWLTSSVSQRVARGPLCAVYSLHGFGIAQLIERLTRDRKVAALTTGKYGGRLFLSILNSLC